MKEAIDVIAEEKLGRTTYRLTEGPTGNLMITRYAIDNTITGTFFMPRALLVAYARELLSEKIKELLT